MHAPVGRNVDSGASSRGADEFLVIEALITAAETLAIEAPSLPLGVVRSHPPHAFILGRSYPYSTRSQQVPQCVVG